MLHCTDEPEQIRRILTQGFSAKGRNLEYFLLAKYYRYEKGLGRAACLRAVLDFCREKIPDFALGDGYRSVTRQINRVFREDQGLISIPCVRVPHSVYRHIAGYPIPEEAKKILFTLYCLSLLHAQAGRDGHWLYLPLTRLKAYANLPQKASMTALLHTCCEQGLLFVSDRGALALTFCEQLAESSAQNGRQAANAGVVDHHPDILIDAADFSRFGLVYAHLCGEKGIARCQMCGMLIKKRGNKQQFCPACAHSRKLSQYAAYNRKRRPAADHQ